MSTVKTPVGGSFILNAVGSEPFLVPEQFDEETRMMGDTARQFYDQEIAPLLDEIEAKDYELLKKLIKKAGEVGFLGLAVEEEYGGLNTSKTTDMYVSERMSGNASWMVSVGAHIGIGTMPILYFGNEAQLEKYLPLSTSGEKIFAYALTEPTSGSDALAAKTRADLSEDGTHYILNGTKQFITNAGFADVFIVFAQVDGDKFTGFIVEKDHEGVSLGPEEKKIGIRGTSTRPVILENAKIPVENVLGEIGQGHKIAFNILNIGRFKLGVGAVGASKFVMEHTFNYAEERTQFGQALLTFPILRRKFAKMAVRAYVAESQVYRLAGYMDGALEELGSKSPKDQLNIIQEYVVEQSIMKVYGSEALDFIVDEGVQIHGGYGYIEEYPVARMYRDSRINRIFEGTNEVNRMLIPGMLLKKVMKGELPLMDVAPGVTQAFEGGGEVVPAPADGSSIETLKYYAEAVNKTAIFLTTLAVQKYMQGLDKEQELLEDIANVISEAYALSSAVGRALQVLGIDEAKGKKQLTVCEAYIPECLDAIKSASRQIIAKVSEGDEIAKRNGRIGDVLPEPNTDIIGLYRNIANWVEEKRGYPF